MKKALKTTFHFMLVCAAALILTVCGGDDDAATGDDTGGNTGTLSNLPGNITITPTVTAATANGDRVAVGTELIATFSGNNNVALNYQWKLDGMNVGTNSDTFIATEPGKYTVTISREGYRKNQP